MQDDKTLDQAPRPSSEASNQVMAFWHGRPWSLLEYSAANSFIKNGYDYTVWSYDPVIGIPKDVKNRDAREIWDIDPGSIKSHAELDSIGPFSDLFRFKLMKQINDILVVDSDEFCLRPFPGDSYLWGLQNTDFVANGVMRVPSKSLLMGIISKMARQYEDKYSSSVWTSTGPKLVTSAIRKVGMLHLTFSSKAFFPMPPIMKMAPYIIKDSCSWTIEEFLAEKRTFGIQMWATGVKYMSKLTNFDVDFNNPISGTFYHKLVSRFA